LFAVPRFKWESLPLADWQFSEEDRRMLEAYEEIDSKPEDKQSG